MIRVHLLIYLTAALLVGCASKQEEYTPLPAAIPIVPGTYVEPEHIDHLRQPETVKGYTVGRYVDPVDSTVMHEERVLYRVENGPSWNLQGNVPSPIPFGGVQSYKPLGTDERLSRAELEVSTAKQRRMHAELREAYATAMSKMDTFRKMAEEAKRRGMENQELLGKLAAAEKEKEELAKQIQLLRGDVQALLNTREMSEDDRIRMKYLRQQ